MEKVMKKILIYSLLALFIFSNLACSGGGTNNKVVNGDVSVKEDSLKSEIDEPIDDVDEVGDEDELEPENVVSEKPEAPKASNSPEALIDDLYKEEEKDNSPFFQNKDRPLIKTYFAKDLADMIWKDAVETKDDEVGKIDFDPLYDAQDAEVADLKIENAEIKGEKATVVVTFLNFGEEQSIKYLTTKENGEWKIEDIEYKEGSLVKILKGENPTAKTTTDE